jgi:hypothetical protein
MVTLCAAAADRSATQEAEVVAMGPPPATRAVQGRVTIPIVAADLARVKSLETSVGTHWLACAARGEWDSETDFRGRHYF